MDSYYFLRPYFIFIIRDFSYCLVHHAHFNSNSLRIIRYSVLTIKFFSLYSDRFVIFKLFSYSFCEGYLYCSGQTRVAFGINRLNHPFFAEQTGLNLYVNVQPFDFYLDCLDGIRNRSVESTLTNLICLFCTGF